MMAPKIIMVQLYANGDCLYATAVARQIKHDFEGCHLTWAIASFCKTIIANNPYVDTILPVDIKKDDITGLRRLRKNLYQQKKEAVYDEVFFIHNADKNHAYYDGSIRSSILRAYPYPITVPVQPVLRLFDEEIKRADEFAATHQLQQFTRVILFEYAPQSGQSAITPAFALNVAEKIAEQGNYAIILSSANKVVHQNKAIIDGSSLTLRETAALSKHCSFLLGSSSGITWVTTSQAGRQLPMVQLLDPYARWVNPISRDFKRFDIPNNKVLELYKFDEQKVSTCVVTALIDFDAASRQFYEPLPLQFKTTRSIVYNLLCYLQFGAIIKHVKINRQVYGNNMAFYKEVILGIILFPYNLLKNIFYKKILKPIKK